MRVKYQRAPITTEWTVGAVANTGNGIQAAKKLGGFKSGLSRSSMARSAGRAPRNLKPDWI